MKKEEKLELFDTQGWMILDKVNPKWLKKHLKKHGLLSIEDVWTEDAAIGLIERYLQVESTKY